MDELKSRLEGFDLTKLEAAVKAVEDLGGLLHSDLQQAVSDKKAELGRARRDIQEKLDQVLQVLCSSSDTATCF
jgi:uncharacterized protein YeeX (DUF496 family)